MRVHQHPTGRVEMNGAPSKRFSFGRNWSGFTDRLDERRVEVAVESVREMLGVADLSGRTFLDIGSGSGLFSLAATRLGASRVHSFDFDPDSVATTEAVRAAWAQGDTEWTIERGDALDASYMAKLGTWDVVYSWGVLHHTGDMWSGIELAQAAVTAGGSLFLAIYNDQGTKSRVWTALKRGYNSVPEPMRLPYAIAVMAPREALSVAAHVARGQAGAYMAQWRGPSLARGMSRWHDLIDWIGGYPFEVARPEEVFDFLQARGFSLRRLSTCAGGLGCNQFVFRRQPA